MQAMIYDVDGPSAGILRAVELPDPEPGAGEVRVRVHVAGVNPTDWKARLNGPAGRPWMQQVPGHDGAGVIDRVGLGVDVARLGEPVWLHLAGHGHPGGSAAQYVCVTERKAVLLPHGVSFDVGAGLGVPALTAHRCLFADGPLRDRTVLVTGGAGAVGHSAIQLARHAGARVITTVSSAEKAAIAATAGPDIILNYRDEDHDEALRAASPDGIDRVVDVAVDENMTSYESLLNQAASVAVYARSSDDARVSLSVRHLMTNNVVVRFMLLYGVSAHHLEEAVTSVGELLRTVGFVPLPLMRYPLSELEAAHAHVRAGAAGKVVVDIPA
jgi:NADPH2:quinone reductase